MNNILNQITMHSDKFYEKISSALNDDMEYKELDKEFYNLLDKFDIENKLAIEEAHTPLLNKYAEAGFGIGFTHAFKILTACYSKTG